MIERSDVMTTKRLQSFDISDERAADAACAQHQGIIGVLSANHVKNK